jgi:hypothetical protein
LQLNKRNQQIANGCWLIPFRHPFWLIEMGVVAKFPFRQLNDVGVARRKFPALKALLDEINPKTAVEHTMREFGVTRLVHGHTHRPAVHRFELDGQPAERLVLGAWHESPRIARATPTGLSLETLR